MRACEICQSEIPPYQGNHRTKTAARRTCGKSCAIKLAHKEGRWHLPNPPNSWGPGNTNWKGGIKWAGPYKMIRVPPGTPGATGRGYMMEHRYKMQRHLGRSLEPWEEIHHRNGKKADNRIANLQIVTHVQHHATIVCPHCQKPFQLH